MLTYFIWQKVEITTEEEDVLSKILGKGPADVPVCEEAKESTDVNCVNPENPVQVESSDITAEALSSENNTTETVLNGESSDLHQTEMESGPVKVEGQENKDEENNPIIEPAPIIPDQVIFLS